MKQFGEDAHTNPACQIEADLIIYNGVKMTKSLIIERVQHLVYCGGVLPRGQVHKWRQREQIILDLCDEIEATSDGILVKKIICREVDYILQEHYTSKIASLRRLLKKAIN